MADDTSTERYNLALRRGAVVGPLLATFLRDLAHAVSADTLRGHDTWKAGNIDIDGEHHVTFLTPAKGISVRLRVEIERTEV